MTNNVRSTNHAKMTTAATFLARTKMVEIEDEILHTLEQELSLTFPQLAAK